MEETKKVLAILNLTGKLSPALEEYFATREIKVIDPLVKFEALEWSHILTKDVIDYSLLGATYKTNEKDVKLISLSRVVDLQNFMLYNGKLVLDEVWMKNSIGTFILDKFLHEYTSMSLTESYPEFEEKGSFKVTNPFSTGEYLDQIVHHAFESNVPALSIKTFFDHLLMYLTSLKQREKAGLPFEVTYGHYDGVFGIQISLFTKQLMMEDVHSSLSSHITKQAEQYFLNIAVQSADFFDFTFLPEVTKTVITGLWTIDERIKFENRGLLFSHQAVATPVALLTTDGKAAPGILHQEKDIEDHTDQMIPAAPSEVPEVTKIKGQEFNESLAQKISSSIDIEKIKQIIAGSTPEDEHSETVAGAKINEDVLQVIKGKIEEEKGAYKVSGGKFDVDKFALRVSSGMEDKLKKGSPMMVAKLEQLPKTIKTGLFDFASRLGKSVELLSSEDIDIFKDFEVPKLLNPQIAPLKSFDIRTDLETLLKKEFEVQDLDSIGAMLEQPEQLKRVREVLKNSLQKSLDDKFQLSSKKELSNREKEVLVSSLTSSLQEQEDKIRDIVDLERGKNIEAAPLFKSELVQNSPLKDQSKLEQENAALKAEKDQLKAQLEKLVSEVRILKESKKQLSEIQQKATTSAGESSATTSAKITDETFKKKIEAQKELVKDDYAKIQQLMDREAKAKKLQIEMQKKEGLFLLELEKSQRQIKSRDTAIEKAKEALSKLATRRENDVNDLKIKLELATKAMMTGPSQTQNQHVKVLEKQNAGMTKMLEMYKDKLSNLAAKVASSKSGEGNSQDEARKLAILNGQYKNLLDVTKRELTKLQDRVTADSSMLISLKQDKIKLEHELKKVGSTHKERTHTADHHEKEIKRLQSTNVDLESQIKETTINLKETTIKLKETETMLTEAMRNQKPQASNEDPSKGKLGHLEASVKKLTMDLVERSNQLGEMKKEINKLRQEKTALQNNLDRNKKEADKAALKAAPPKKNDGGKAA